MTKAVNQLTEELICSWLIFCSFSNLLIDSLFQRLKYLPPTMRGGVVRDGPVPLCSTHFLYIAALDEAVGS